VLTSQFGEFGPLPNSRQQPSLPYREKGPDLPGLTTFSPPRKVC